jgi:AraC-like DNA-binding protein
MEWQSRSRRDGSLRSESGDTKQFGAEKHLLPHQQPRARLFETGEGPSRWLAIMLRPRPPLDEIVECLWYVEGSEACSARLPPIGGTELVINLGAPYELAGAGHPHSSRLFKGAWVEGLRDGWLESRARGCTALMGARFRAAGAYRIMGPAIRELGNRLVEADEILGRDLPRLRQRLGNERDTGGRFDTLESYLAARVDRGYEIDRRAAWAAGQLGRGENGSQIRRLGAEMSISRQRFVELFHRHVGLTPKRFARIVRFGGVIRSLAGAIEPDWPVVALEHGFYDQSHLVGEFQRMAGCSPTQFLKRRDGLSQSVVMMD